MKKIFIVILSLTVLFTVPIVKAAYNYSPLMDVIASAEALIINQVIDSSNLVDKDKKSVEIDFGTLVDVP